MILFGEKRTVLYIPAEHGSVAIQRKLQYYFWTFRCCKIECSILVTTLGFRSDLHHKLFKIKRANIFLLFCLSLVISKVKITTLLFVGISEGSSTKLKWAEQEPTFLLYVMIQQNRQYLLDQQRIKRCIWLRLKIIHKISRKL